jgi:hypothetical protein
MGQASALDKIYHALYNRLYRYLFFTAEAQSSQRFSSAFGRTRLCVSAVISSFNRSWQLNHYKV